MPAQASDDDLPLVHRAQGGDFAAFEALVSKYERRVFALALRILNRRHDAEEVVQQTFLTLIERITEFREEARFSTWLMRIATNAALALRRRESVRQTAALDEARRDEPGAELPRPRFIAQWKVTPEQLAQQRETREILDRALAELNEKHRLVFVLRDVEGLSTEETARALGISVSNAKVRLMRARLTLREKLTQLFGDEQARVEPAHRHR